ncbi:hypothetical protein Plo01_27750 [Planobispora longispora]|uniref:Uncharacterized protein n=1 Tax=Planobispora longispora TaxID=28887 RepID=A0A8J3RH97_9ACTN|nr:hypothetical protein GCM10020093_045290 [Planobispora longispora]GIH76346.1 hypothetical protein Plo01_27750 [Planobispora longispora]
MDLRGGSPQAVANRTSSGATHSGSEEGGKAMRRIRIKRPQTRRPIRVPELDLRSPSGRRLPY